MSYFIIVRGPLGIGKSTIAQELTKILGAKYFPIDRILEEYNLTDEKEKGYISQKSFISANKIISPEIQNILALNIPVVIDGNFYWQSQIDDLIKRLNSPNYIFTLKAPLETCIERDRKRNGSHGADAAEAVYRKSTELNCGISIDTQNKTSADVVKEILFSLKMK